MLKTVIHCICITMLQLKRLLCIVGIGCFAVRNVKCTCGLSNDNYAYDLSDPCNDSSIASTLPGTINAFIFDGNRNLIAAISNYDFSIFGSCSAISLDNTGITELPSVEKLPSSLEDLSLSGNSLNKTSFALYNFSKFGKGSNFGLILTNTGITELPRVENLPSSLTNLNVNGNILNRASLALYDFRKFGSPTSLFNLNIGNTDILHIPSADKLPEYLFFFTLAGNPLDEAAFLAYNFSKFTYSLRLDIRNTSITKLPPANQFPVNFDDLRLDDTNLNCLDCTTMTTLFELQLTETNMYGLNCIIPSIKPVCLNELPTPSSNTTTPAIDISVGAIIGISIGVATLSVVTYFIATRFC